MTAGRNEHAPAAFGASVLLHAAVIGLLVLAAAVLQSPPAPTPKIFELVQGQGDNYLAKEAPALGSPTAMKIDVPMGAPMSAAPPAPVQVQPAVASPPVRVQPVNPPAPVALVRVHHPAPKSRTPAKTKSAPAPITDYSKFLKHVEARRVIHDRWEEHMMALRQARAEAARARAEAAAQHMTYAEYLKQHGLPAAALSRGSLSGVTRGRGAAPGAGGKALTRAEADELDLYFSELKQQLHDHFVPPPDAVERMAAHVEFYLAADGSISNVKITHSTGDDAFNQAVLEAFRQVRMPPRPDHQGEQDGLDVTLSDLTG